MEEELYFLIFLNTKNIYNHPFDYFYLRKDVFKTQLNENNDMMYNVKRTFRWPLENVYRIRNSIHHQFQCGD